MPRRVKPPEDIDVAAFFAGVDELRVHLDRHTQDPARRRERLLRLASELARSRQLAGWSDFFTRTLAEAIGASAAELWLRGNDAERPAAVRGFYVAQTTGRKLEVGAGLPIDLLGREIVTFAQGHGLVVPLTGIDNSVGVVWLEVAQPLDSESRNLLQAIADTGGVAVEQALALAAIA